MVTDLTSQYSFGLSADTLVRWYFEGKELPTVALEDVDIVIPAFEAKALTHFQDCHAELVKQGETFHVYIELKDCAHPPEVYAPILQQREQ